MKAFILGASGDIGQAIAKKFTVGGYQVIAPTRREMDLEDKNSIAAYLKQNVVLDVDVVIQSAGWNSPKAFEDTTLADIDKTHSINVTSFYQVLQHIVPALIKKGDGHILAISSIYGFIARNKRLPYVMSKHALNGLVKTLAIELGRHNIKVNALAPGFVDTKMTRKNNDAVTIKDFEGKIPLGRLASVADIAEVAYFLCSPLNRYITGQNIIVDGGYSIGGFQK